MEQRAILGGKDKGTVRGKASICVNQDINKLLNLESFCSYSSQCDRWVKLQVSWTAGETCHVTGWGQDVDSIAGFPQATDPQLPKAVAHCRHIHVPQQAYRLQVYL